MRRALGKGLSQLLGEQADAVTNSVSVHDIRANSRQPRTQFNDEALDELAASIREHGILQPLIVRPLADGKYELIAGERRLRAAKKANLSEVPVIVRAASAQASLEIALIENVQRADISPMECAVAYQRLAEEFDMSQEQIAARVGKSRAAVANTLRLLKLPTQIQQAVLAGKVTEGHARALLMVDSPVRQMSLFHRVVDEGISVREAEREARLDVAPQPKPTRTTKPTKDLPAHNDANWAALEQGLSEYFGSLVRLVPGEVGGKLTIDFYSDDDLERILEILGVRL